MNKAGAAYVEWCDTVVQGRPTCKAKPRANSDASLPPERDLVRPSRPPLSHLGRFLHDTDRVESDVALVAIGTVLALVLGDVRNTNAATGEKNMSAMDAAVAVFMAI